MVPSLAPKMLIAASVGGARVPSFAKASRSANRRGSVARAKATRTVWAVDAFVFKTDTAVFWPVTLRIVAQTASTARRFKPKAV